MTYLLALKLAEDGDAPEDSGVAKESVLAELAQIVSEGGARLATLESGALELRLATGEVFHLGEETVTRIA
jgi:hypothetical protein